MTMVSLGRIPWFLFFVGGFLVLSSWDLRAWKEGSAKGIAQSADDAEGSTGILPVPPGAIAG